MSDPRNPRKKEYDWIDDPFKDEPQQLNAGMGSGSKIAIGCGCAIVLVALVVVGIMFVSGLSSVLAA